jgi:hypothetical protein
VPAVKRNFKILENPKILMCYKEMTQNGCRSNTHISKERKIDPCSVAPDEDKHSVVFEMSTCRHLILLIISSVKMAKVMECPVFISEVNACQLVLLT